jgi:hypothetical protein
MGFFFRKSIGFGPVRLNFSKSGVGASVGVKGARLTVPAHGSTYITVGSHGFYYRQSVKTANVAGARTQEHSSHSSASAEEPRDGTIPTASIGELVECSNKDLVRQLNERANVKDTSLLAWISCGIGVMAAVLASDPRWLAPTVVLATLARFLHRRHVDHTTTRLIYSLSDAESVHYARVQQAIEHLAKSQRVWRITQEVAVNQPKLHAGASSVIMRHSVGVGPLQIPRVTANVPMTGIHIGDIKMCLLPDMILYWQNGTFANIPYEALRATQSITRFIEDGSVPTDAVVVGKTWKYVNKDGGPDRRFNNNRQLPIVQYGQVDIVSSHGLNIHLQVSSVDSAAGFASRLEERSGRSHSASAGPNAPPGETGSRAKSDVPPSHAPTRNTMSRAQALKILGLGEAASAEEISAAYRRMARLNHPDKVASLDPEFRALADQRMKDINAAYALLRSA